MSFIAGVVAVTADGVLAFEGKQSPATVGLDIAALVPSLGVLKEGKEIVAGVKDISHTIQHANEHFQVIEEQWKAVRNIYGDLGGATVSIASRECKMNCVNSPNPGVGVYKGSERTWN
ncbi:hypothetical protein [Alicyclobacillus vulcanalis]|uniref:hypothetical protein n=1 Tax=Alicyclobacillus vulcanalis TaxID=252246 RepID=UPI001178A9FF|nr:hypothetical protein [Alicyclobacillus vulcanalis]